MANRPVFAAFRKAPYSVTYHMDFVWNAGLSISQKKKNIRALHEAFHQKCPDAAVLEISSKSEDPIGTALSAFSLKKFVPSLGVSVPVECVFQGGKKFLYGGPYMDLYLASAREAKRDERLKTSGPLCGFFFEGKDFPLKPETAFYDWLYINALLEAPALAEQVLKYDAFTDIEFNPEKSKNCQARAAALFVSLSRLGLLERCRDYDTFVEFLVP